jgi:hypothetical protein
MAFVARVADLRKHRDAQRRARKESTLMHPMLRKPQSLLLNPKIPCLLVSMVIAAGAATARATENGGSAFPVGVETVMTGMYPAPGETVFAEFTLFYEANEVDNGQGKSAAPEFKLRVFGTAVKMSRTWERKVPGGYLNSYIAIPELYEQLHVAPGKFEKYAFSNVILIPLAIVNHKGFAHWYYEGDFFTPVSAYSPNDVLNVGQHNVAVGPVAGFTLLPMRGKTEVSVRNTYLFNGPDRDTHYHSGNEYFSEFNVAEQVSKKAALGFNGYIYQQTTNDKLNGAVFAGGYRGRDLAIGPQLRVNLPHGAFAFKYLRDTLVENKPRGSAFWFQIGVPFPGLSRGRL